MFKQAVPVFASKCVQSRNMATLQEISIRLKSIKNIQKITKSMKMVSAAKYARAEKELIAARPYGTGVTAFFDNLDVAVDESKPNRLCVALTSDRGLCGGVHSSIVRAIKAEVDANKDANVKVVAVGDKSRTGLQRHYANHILFAGKDFGRQPPTFADASLVAQEIIDSGFEYDSGNVYYNKFRSVISYKTSKVPVFSLQTVSEAENLAVYDSVDADVLTSYNEFALASTIYYGMKEGAVSEQSSRMTSMDGATKNAGEMIDKLTLTYNRTRQAVITRELIEIISGASALD